MNDDSFVRMIPIIVSILALLVSLTTAWLTLFRRGRLQMTHPTIVAFGYDESYERSPKVFLRTLLFSTSKRGQIIESMFVELSQGSATHIFSFWGYGEATNLVRGSGLRVGEEGVALHHHFLLANDLHEFHFKPGRHIIRVYATTIYRRTPILLSTICLELTADESFAVDRDRRAQTDLRH